MEQKMCIRMLQPIFIEIPFYSNYQDVIYKQKRISSHDIYGFARRSLVVPRLALVVPYLALVVLYLALVVPHLAACCLVLAAERLILAVVRLVPAGAHLVPIVVAVVLSGAQLRQRLDVQLQGLATDTALFLTQERCRPATRAVGLLYHRAQLVRTLHFRSDLLDLPGGYIVSK